MDINTHQVPVISRMPRWDAVAYTIFLVLIFLLPLFFIPSINFPFDLSKNIVLSLVVMLILGCSIIARIKDRTLTIPKNAVSFSMALVALSFVVASLVSGLPTVTFFGQTIEMGTASNILLMVVLFFITTSLCRTKDRILYVYCAFVASFVVLGLFHLSRLLFGADFISFGILTDATSNTIGKWNDVGIFFTLGSLLSLITLEFLPVSKLLKVVAYVFLVIGLFFAAIVNFTFGWWTLLAVSLLIVGYKWYSMSRTAPLPEVQGSPAPKLFRQKKVAGRAIVVIIVACIVLFASVNISNVVSSRFKISQLEVRPSWRATYDIAVKSEKKHLFFGSGPNTFTHEYLLYKPQVINSTIFWNSDFSFGVGLIPTFIVTTGLVGALAWLIFFIFFVLAGIRLFRHKHENALNRYISFSSYGAALFLWILSVVYIPSSTLFAYAFVFTGLFVASQVIEKRSKVLAYSLVKNSKLHILHIAVSCALLVLILLWMRAYILRFVAGAYLQEGLVSLNIRNNLDEGEKNILKAVSFNGADVYYQSLSELGIVKMGRLLANSKNANQEAVLTELQSLLSTTLFYANSAVTANPTNYQNWISAGRVFESVVDLQVKGAYESAVNAYNKALELNPLNPSIYLMLARLEAAAKKYDAAKDHIGAALQVKNNYTEAIYLLSQIQVAEGNIKDAIKSVEVATQISPNEPTVFFELGLLRYNAKDYAGTIEAMNKAIDLNPQYSNARYFLGLSYARLNKFKEAIAQFEKIKELNPDNQEVTTILENLRAGKQPFTDVKPPLDSKPESRSKLPVKDSDKKTSSAVRTN